MWEGQFDILTLIFLHCILMHPNVYSTFVWDVMDGEGEGVVPFSHHLTSMFVSLKRINYAFWGRESVMQILLNTRVHQNAMQKN